jgi:c(7)-type cytochrome triheme protein
MRLAVPLLLGALAVIASLIGCSPESRYRVLGLLFDDVPRPGEDAPLVPVIRSPRRPAPATPTPTPTAVAQASPDMKESPVFNTWDDVVRLLPKNQVGNPDWVAALDEKLIAPRPGIAPEAVEPEGSAADVELTPKSDPAFKVIFSHQKHGGWLTCSNCHPGRFAMKAGATPMAAGDGHQDRYCAACHGKVAFDIVTGCPLCHLQTLPKDPNGRVDWSRALAENLIAPRAGPSAKAVDQPTLDRDVEFAPQTQPALKSVFSHATHTRSLACSNCHPRPFAEAAAAAGPRGADLHSRRYCGACHGTVAFGMIGFCGRCHPALEKARQHQQILDLDSEIAPKSQPSGKTVFSHKIHRWVECASCHSNLFEPTAGVTKMAMADIYGGKYCAGCHGKVTADLITQCQRCHPAGEAK